MKRITMISGSMPPLACGIGSYTNQLLSTLGKLEDITLLTTKGLHGHSAVRKTEYVDSWKITNIPKIISLLRSGKPDIIHIQYPAKGYKRELGINLLPLALRIRSPKVSIFLTLHEYFGSGLLGKTRNFITALFVHKILVSNPYDFQALPKLLRRKSVIVPIGSNIPITKKNPITYKSVLKEAGFESKVPVIFFGFPFANKGIELLIELAVRSDITVLLLCGFDQKDEYQKQLEDKIKEARSKGALIFVAGFLSDQKVSEILQEAEIFVLPQDIPLTAKSGTTIAAATHGMTVISKAASNSDFNLPYIDNYNSVLLSKMTVGTLQNAIADLQSNPKKLKRLRENTEDLVKYFSWEGITDMHCELYEQDDR